MRETRRQAGFFFGAFTFCANAFAIASSRTPQRRSGSSGFAETSFEDHAKR
jgi:hypothetical protein